MKFLGYSVLFSLALMTVNAATSEEKSFGTKTFEYLFPRYEQNQLDRQVKEHDRLRKEMFPRLKCARLDKQVAEQMLASAERKVDALRQKMIIERRQQKTLWQQMTTFFLLSAEEQYDEAVQERDQLIEDLNEKKECLEDVQDEYHAHNNAVVNLKKEFETAKKKADDNINSRLHNKVYHHVTLSREKELERRVHELEASLKSAHEYAQSLRKELQAEKEKNKRLRRALS